MKIWIDLANSPQVLFFRPLIAAWGEAGHEVRITTRSYAQTLPLADRFGLAHVPVGAHGGRGFGGLVIENLRRSWALARWGRGQAFDLAVSHNAYSQIVAARLLGLRVATTMDYEHQPLNSLAFRLAHRVVVPEVYPTDRLRAQGGLAKAIRYHGIKEQMYLAGFIPQANFRSRHKLPADQPLVVIRPPANWTAYHRFENDLFDQLLAHLAARPGPYYLFLPRLPDQAEAIARFPALHTSHQIFDGPDLLYNAAVVIGAGGTMNREAAVLGTQTYTLFQGKATVVDRYLMDLGRLAAIRNPADFERIRPDRAEKQKSLVKPTLIQDLAEILLDH
jgi:hypothetical protein